MWDWCLGSSVQRIDMETMKIIVIAVIVGMWLIFLGFLIRYGEYVRNDPCSVCAKRMQGDVTCSLTSAGGTVTRGYIRNGTIWDSQTRTNGAGGGFGGFGEIQSPLS